MRSNEQGRTPGSTQQALGVGAIARRRSKRGWNLQQVRPNLALQPGHYPALSIAMHCQPVGSPIAPFGPDDVDLDLS